MCRFESGHPHHIPPFPLLLFACILGRMMTLIQKTLSNSCVSYMAFACLSAASLAAAFTAQYVFGLQPCVLCIYQRWPFAIVIALGALGMAFSKASSCVRAAVMGLISLTFFANTAIAFYHTGVERHWWKSFLEGCAVPEMTGNITDVLAKIAATPAVRCDEIPWTDPVLGLSMANYNVALCFVLGVLALISACAIKRQTSSQSPASP